MSDAVEVPHDIAERLRTICLALPETYEVPAWLGFRWRIRKSNFAHVWCTESATRTTTVLMFWSLPPERDVLASSGHPFWKPAWGKNVLCMALDDRTDWTEVAEIVTESYCVHAPKKLAAQVAPPG